jgi:hypothetical protein
MSADRVRRHVGRVRHRIPLAVASAGRSPRSTGAPGERREAVDQHEVSPAGMPARFSTVQGCTVRKPRPPHADPLHMDVQRARRRGALSLGYFSLLRASCPPPLRGRLRRSRRSCGAVGTQREVTRAGRRTDRKLLILLWLRAPTCKSRGVQASDQDPTYVDRRARRAARHRNDSIASCRAVGRILMRRRATPAVQTAEFGPTHPALAQGVWRLLQGCRLDTQQGPRCGGVGSRSDLRGSEGAAGCQTSKRQYRQLSRCRSHLDATPRYASGADGGFRSDLSGSRSRLLALAARVSVRYAAKAEVCRRRIEIRPTPIKWRGRLRVLETEASPTAAL